MMLNAQKVACPVEVGDIFYRPYIDKKTGREVRDRIEVMMFDTQDPEKWVFDEERGIYRNYWRIHGQYLNRGNSSVERDFSDLYFRNPDVVIEQKNTGRRKFR